MRPYITATAMAFGLLDRPSGHGLFTPHGRIGANGRGRLLLLHRSAVT
jgi:hypothetical protein